MTPPSASLSSAARARDFRRAFDGAFAAPPPPPNPPSVALLIVRAGGEVLAIERGATVGFARADQLVRAPGRSPAFLGLAAVHGELYPVWSLAGLLGQPGPESGAGWLVLTRAAGDAPCALHCEVFERMILVPAAALAATARRDPPPGLSPAMAPWESTLVPVVDLAAVHAEIRKRKEKSPP